MYVFESNKKILDQTKTKIINFWSSTKNNIEFIQSNNLKLKQFLFSPVELIFINPKWKSKKQIFEIKSIEDLEPNFLDLLKEGLALSQNIVVCLPNYLNLGEIAKIIKEYTEKHYM